jgi:hypothetical protein
VIRALVVSVLVAAALLASQAAWAKEVFGTRGNDRIVGTASADVIRPRAGADTVDARGGNDRIVSAADDAPDSIVCGAGVDLALVGGGDRVARDCERIVKQLSRDRSSDPLAQHETAVEPHSFSFGRAIVTAYQLGRLAAGGGAGAIGWSTSSDAGATWRSGTLQTPFPAVSDPVVAYDAVHRTWLITFVALTRPRVDVYLSRSSDGLTWSAPIAVAVAPSPDADYDKEWIVCDNGAASAFRGRCYVSYLDTGSTTILTRASTDGGRTWGPPVGSRAGLPDGAFVNGAVPVVRSNGDLLVLVTVFAPFGGSGDWVAATRSTDGGETFSSAARVAALRAEDPVGMRAPPLVSVAVDPSGAVRAVWADCRFDEQCRSNDVVMAVSRDGLSWAPPVRLPTGVASAVARTDALIPAVAVSGTSIAVAYYTLPQPSGCVQLSCRGLDAWMIVQRAGKWTPPQRLSPQPMPLSWLADGGIGAMVGDYVSVTWSAGMAFGVLALATEPEGGVLREAVYAAAAA